MKINMPEKKTFYFIAFLRDLAIKKKTLFKNDETQKINIKEYDE